MDIGTWWALVHGVTKSWTRLSNFHFHIDFTSAWDLIYKTETDSQMWRKDLSLPSGRELARKGLGGLRLERESGRKVPCSVTSGSLQPHRT